MQPEQERMITLFGQEFRLKRLSCIEIFKSFGLCSALKQWFRQEGLDQDIEVSCIDAMCEHAVLGALSLYQADERAFESAEILLHQVTMEELILIHDTYQQYFAASEHQQTEMFQNESFEQQCIQQIDAVR